MPEDDPIYELGAIVAAVRRRAVLILALTALAAVAAAAVSLSQPDRYEATATLLFRAPGLDEQIFDRSVPVGGNDVYDGDTNTGLVALRSVAVRTAEGADVTDSAAEVDEAVTVSPGAGAGLVEVTAADETADGAAALANAYAEAYNAERRDQNRAEVERARRAIERQLSSLPPGDDGELAGRLREDLGDLDTLAALQTSDADVVDEALPPSSAASPKPLRDAIAGGLAGLVLGLLAAFALERSGGRRVTTSRG